MKPELQFLYIVEAVGLKVYKIGYAKDVEKRVRSLTTGCPVPLRIVLTIPTKHPARVERYIHQQFDKKRRHLEWFAISPKDIEEIKYTTEQIKDRVKQALKEQKEKALAILYPALEIPPYREIEVTCKGCKDILKSTEFVSNAGYCSACSTEPTNPAY